MKKKIIEIIESECAVENITEQTPIEALGLDSLDYIHLLNSIRFGVGNISVDMATSAQTVGELIQAVKV